MRTIDAQRLLSETIYRPPALHELAAMGMPIAAMRLLQINDNVPHIQTGILEFPA